MKNFDAALDQLIAGFEGFTEKLRDIADDLPQGGVAGAGEINDAFVDAPEAADAREDIDDDTMITMRSGDLRKVLDSYRKLTRYAREGRIPTMDERVKLHMAVRKVKHLVRKPIR